MTWTPADRARCLAGIAPIAKVQEEAPKRRFLLIPWVDDILGYEATLTEALAALRKVTDHLEHVAGGPDSHCPLVEAARAMLKRWEVTP